MKKTMTKTSIEIRKGSKGKQKRNITRDRRELDDLMLVSVNSA